MKPLIIALVFGAGFLCGMVFEWWHYWKVHKSFIESIKYLMEIEK
jgi:heme/copper-type cytochrome/quinol oxidase subunit 3